MKIEDKDGRDWPDNGDYWHRACRDCGYQFNGPKRAPCCWLCKAARDSAALRAQPARQDGGDNGEAMAFADILLMWNRRHEQPPIMVGYEYGVAAAMLDAARAALAPAAVCVIPEALRLVELLGLVAEKAFHLADGTQEDLTGETPVFTVDGDDFQALSDALDKCDEEPEIDDVYARDGWLTVLDKLRALLAQWKEVGA